MVRFPPEQRSEKHAAAPTLQAIFEDGGLPLGEDLRRAVEAWLAHLAHERGSTDNTLEAYERDLRQFLAWLKADLGHAPCLADLARLDARRFRAFMAARRRAGVASRSLRRAMSALRAFFRWLEAEEIARNRGILQVALPKVPHGIPKPLTRGEGRRRGRRRRGGRARLDRRARYGGAAAALRLGPAHLRGAGPRAAGMRPRAGREVLRIVGKGGKERLVPVLPVTQAGHRALHGAVPLSARPRTARCSSAPRAAA